MAKSASQKSKSPSQLIDERIKDTATGAARCSAGSCNGQRSGTWSRRGVELASLSDVVTRRNHLHRRDCARASEDDLRQGGVLKDPSGLFNSSLERNTRRAIDFHEGEKINKQALKALLRAAVALNESKAKR